LASLLPSPTSIPGFRGGVLESYSLGLSSLFVLAIGMLVTRSASQRRPWVYGWRTPVDGGGWWLSPLALLGALPVAAWLSGSIGTRSIELIAATIAGGLAITAGEVWFRGLVHGLLVPDHAVQRPQGPWQLSRAAFASSAAYAVVASILVAPAFDHRIFSQLGTSEIEFMIGSLTLFFAAGLALATLRERSLSFLPGLTVLLIAFSVVAAVRAFLPG